MTSNEKKPIPALNDPKEDQFQSYKKDPRLPTGIEKKAILRTSTLQNELIKNLNLQDDEEDFLNKLRQFKHQKTQETIKKLESQPLKNRPLILAELSKTAQTIVEASLFYLKHKLSEKYGLPTFLSSYKQVQEAYLAIVAMGKFGSQSLNYESDLDMIFIYSNRGETYGKKVISNGEFFAKLAQKFISSLSLLTSAGRCYQIDTELRPSGNTGTLVTSYDHFVDHQMNRAQNWERQALIRARCLCVDAEFQNKLSDQIQKLTYERPLPTDYSKNMHKIRQQVIQEKVKETKQCFNLKLGPGGLMDIDFIIHNIQLRFARIHKDLRVNSLSQAFDSLKKHDFLSKSQLNTLQEGYWLYQTLLALLQLDKRRSINRFNCESDSAKDIAQRLGFANILELQDKLVHTRSEIQEIYKTVYKV